MTYICNCCSKHFDEPEEFFDRHPYGDTYAEESFYGCPYCGGSYEEAVECEECGKLVPESESYDGYCSECYSKLEEEESDEI